ncbi:aldose epimerase family protein [Lachnospiraceae bacterium LCP25S3_G4]
MNRELTSIKISEFGSTSKGEEAKLYTMTNKNGMQVSVTDYGATLVSAWVPDQDCNLVDVVLGYDDVSGYERSKGTFFGASVGRNANRISKASFQLNGKTYQLEKNDNGNNLHSGTDYWSKRMWQVRSKNETSITLTLHSANGDQGYPGALDMEVKYSLTKDNELKIEYFSTPNEDTIINMTNHSYFNLNGHSNGSILEQLVWIDADYYTENNEKSIPTGELVEVKGTPMDFTVAKSLGRDIYADYKALHIGHGYDHNWVLNNRGKFAKVAEMESLDNGIVMEVLTDLPGVQLYTANFLDGSELGKGGYPYPERSGVCFETQYFPDAIHHAEFKGPICKAGDVYRTTTMYRFLVA